MKPEENIFYWDGYILFEILLDPHKAQL